MVMTYLVAEHVVRAAGCFIDTQYASEDASFEKLTVGMRGRFSLLGLYAINIYV
jgi:hypothetical protein